MADRNWITSFDASVFNTKIKEGDHMADAETLAAVLAAPMEANDADASTVGDYLVRLLSTVWREGEGFSGKRPFGTSGWESEIYSALVLANLVDGEFLDGYLEDVDETTAHALVTDAIRLLWPKWAVN